MFFLSLCVFFSSGFARGVLVTHNLSSLSGLAQWKRGDIEVLDRKKINKIPKVAV